jgi:hypothetical protein
MKKLINILTLLLVLTMVCSIFTACDIGNPSKDQNNEPAEDSQGNEQTPEENEAEKHNLTVLSTMGDENGIVLTVNGEALKDGDSVEIAEGSQATVSIQLPALGYTLFGWANFDTLDFEKDINEQLLSTSATYTFTMGENDFSLVALVQDHKAEVRLITTNGNEDDFIFSIDGVKGGDDHTKTVIIGAEVTVSIDLINDDYKFLGWVNYETFDFSKIEELILSTETTYTFTMGEEDITLLALVSEKE